MRIPVFLSCPTKLSRTQQTARQRIVNQLSNLGLEERTLGVSDYPSLNPLRETLVLAKHCSGGVILGFEQLLVADGTRFRGISKHEHRLADQIPLPTPWNQLEAGLMFALDLPLLVFRESGVEGGVFDNGVTDVFIHPMPIGVLKAAQKQALAEVFLNWQRRVRAHYYEGAA